MSIFSLPARSGGRGRMRGPSDYSLRSQLVPLCDVHPPLCVSGRPRAPAIMVPSPAAANISNERRTTSGSIRRNRASPGQTRRRDRSTRGRRRGSASLPMSRNECRDLKPSSCRNSGKWSESSARNRRLQYRREMDFVGQGSDPLLSAVSRKRLLCDLNHAEALQNLDIASHRAPIAFQFLRQ